MGEELGWRERAKKLREEVAAEEARRAANTPPPSTDDTSAQSVRPGPQNISGVDFDEDLVPENDLPQRTEQDDQIDRLLDGIGVVEAYKRWCGKSEVRPTQRTEGIKVSCPNPNHPDKNPSAWLNTEKNVWACGACNFTGGDTYDIAAWHFGFPVPAYKKGKTFHDLRERMAEDLGYRVKKTLGGKTTVQPIVTEDSQGPPKADKDADKDSAPDPDQSLQKTDLDTEIDPAVASPATNVVTLPTALNQPRPSSESKLMPAIDWRNLLDSDSFLRSWMDATKDDDLPEEYYFWLGLQALGLAVGHDVMLDDNPPVKGNLFICLFGPTGIGKSRSTGLIERLLREAIPFNNADEYPTGVLTTPSPGSPEALVDLFARPVKDADGEVIDHAPIRGLVRFDELATLIGRSERSGNPMKPALMEFYDSYGPVRHVTRTYGAVEAHNHFAACTTTTQPQAIRYLIQRADIDSGFMNRWVFACGPSKKPIDYGRKPHNIEPAVEHLKKIHAWAAQRKHAKKSAMVLEGAARSLYRDFFYKQIVPIKNQERNEFVMRVDLTIKKLILLFTINRRIDQPDEHSVTTAIALWDYLIRSYSILRGHVGITEVDDCIDAICARIERLKEKGAKPTKSSIRSGISRDKYSLELVNRALKIAIELEIVTETAVRMKNGKIVEIYDVAQA